MKNQEKLTWNVRKTSNSRTLFHVILAVSTHLFRNVKDVVLKVETRKVVPIISLKTAKNK